MALQAQQVHLAHTQVTRIARSVRRVATAATLGLHWHVFIDKWTSFIRVTLGADSIPAGQGPYLPESRCSVHVVAVTALDKAFVDPMVVRFGEVSLRGGVTAVAQLGWCYCEQMLRFLCVVRRVTVEAADVAAGMR